MAWFQPTAKNRAVTRVPFALVGCATLSIGFLQAAAGSFAEDNPQPTPAAAPGAEKPPRDKKSKPAGSTRQTPKSGRTDWPSLRTDLRKFGRNGNAIAAGEAAVAASRKTFGDVSDRLASDLTWLATFYVEVDDFKSARPVLDEVVAIHLKLHGEKDYRTADARRAVAEADLRSRLTPAERKELVEADHESLTGADRSIAPADSLKSATHSYEIRRRLLGPGHPLVARSLRWQGLAYQRLRQFDRAESSLRESEKIRLKVLGDNPDTAGSLESLALLKEEQDDIPAAIALCRRELDMRRRLFGEESTRTAESWYNLARMAARRPTFADAETACQRALAIREKLLGPDHLQTAFTLNLLGQIEQGLTRFSQAEDALNRALAIRQKQLGNDHRVTLDTRVDLARLLERMSQYPRAAQMFQQVLDARRRLLGEEHALTGDAYSGLGFCYMLMGEYAKARPAMKRAVEILQKSRGEDHALTCSASLNLARLYSRVGDAAKAEPLFQKTLLIEQRVRPGGLQAARVRDGMVEFYLTRRDFPHAEQLCRDSLEIKRRVLGEQHPDFHVTLDQLGAVYRAEGRYVEARDTFEKTLKFAQQSLGDDHLFVANLLCELGNTAHDMNDDAGAAHLFTQELDVAKRLYRGDHPITARALFDLGSNQYCVGRRENAALLLSDALVMCQNVLRENFGVLAQREQLALEGQHRRYLDVYLSVTDELQVPAAATYRHLLAAKGAVTADQWLSRLERRRPELAPLTEQMRDIGARLAHLSFSTPDRSHREAWLKEISDLTEQKERVEQELANKSAVFRDGRLTTRPDPNALRKLLPANAALIDILAYARSFSRKPDEKTRRKAELRFVAFVLRRDAEIRRIELGPADPIVQKMKTWRETYGANQGSVDVGRELRDRIWKPLEPELKGAETVLLSPDGAFCSFPLAALPGSKPGGYLIEERNIVMVPVPQLLLQTKNGSLDSEPAMPTSFDAPLLVGNVDFDADPRTLPATAVAARGEAPQGLFSPLPGTSQEIDDVAGIYRGAFHREPLALTGKRASEQAVRGETPRHRWLHFATHGFFAPSSVLTAEKAQPVADRAAGNLIGSVEAARGFHPSLLSGIVLAGANRGWASRDRRSSKEVEDGLLTALDVEQMNLADTELVVLSACETGLGRLAGGEGALGLQRAFQVAGARNVIASLWKVDDQATATLIHLFYLNLWVKKQSPADALRNAQLAILHAPSSVTAIASNRGLDFDKQGKLAKPQKATATVPTGSPRLWAAFVLSQSAVGPENRPPETKSHPEN
ncbi:MAG TPA: CHAT domain-containing tetratricopeptide repeat protein [Planctomycetaceae bacterium]|jgi:CHAT domain-containing protein|nr:CHAT domain-containing tetratricopeptide repeat protein [Planctomycetaceae bacterium]